MSSLTLNIKLDESRKPFTNELGDPEENHANRRQARLMAAMAVERLNRLRERKKAGQTAKKTDQPSPSPLAAGTGNAVRPQWSLK